MSSSLDESQAEKAKQKAVGDLTEEELLQRFQKSAILPEVSMLPGKLRNFKVSAMQGCFGIHTHSSELHLLSDQPDLEGSIVPWHGCHPGLNAVAHQKLSHLGGSHGALHLAGHKRKVNCVGMQAFWRCMAEEECLSYRQHSPFPKSISGGKHIKMSMDRCSLPCIRQGCAWICADML